MSEIIHPEAVSFIEMGLTPEQLAKAKEAQVTWQCPAGHVCQEEEAEVSFGVASAPEIAKVTCSRRRKCFGELPRGGP